MRTHPHRGGVRKGGSGKALPLLLSSDTLTCQGVTPLPYRGSRVRQTALDCLARGRKNLLLSVKGRTAKQFSP